MDDILYLSNILIEIKSVITVRGDTRKFIFSIVHIICKVLIYS